MNAIVKVVRTEMAATTFTLVLMLLVTTAAASVLPSEPVATAEKEPAGQPKILGGNSISSMELYHSMEMGEQEKLESLGGNDDEDDNEKDSGDSLLSIAGGGADDNDIDQENLTELLTCVSCSGKLPAQWDDRNSDVDEQSYCLYDGIQPLAQDGNTDKELYVCSGAVRCYKTKVREEDGIVRISRGCMGGGHGGGHRHSSQTNAELHPCMGAISNDLTTKNNDTSKQPRTWTSSHTFSSASAGQQLPSTYAIECCNGRDRCNDGPFPSLSGGGSSTIDDNGSLLAAMTRWRWSSISVAALLIAVVIVATFTLKKRKRRKRSKSSSSRRSKRRNRSARHHDEVDSDDSDKKRPRHLSLSSMSSSLSSVVSSSSCCEGKKRRGRRKQHHVTALTMVDLLKGVVVTNETTADNENTYGSSSNRPSYTTEYSPAAMTESTVDDDFLPPPYQRRNDNHQKDDWTSGSGYGLPLLVQRTLAKQIDLRQLVGKGRYGEVWRATYWNGGHEQVAVKIFLSKDEPSWKRETEIYSTVLMRHDNILGFIGSDIMTSQNSYTTQLLLITHFHEHGSLYDFLQTPAAVAASATCNGYDIDSMVAGGGRPQQIDRDRPPLTVRQMLNVLYTVASGLCHLHTEINGTQGNVKPVIAHRDIKSKNVLVKCAKTGVCCVADFGMAVTSWDTMLPIQTTAAMGANQNTRVGTKRYMAPEVLDDSVSSSAVLALASASTTTTAVPSVASSSTSFTATNDTPKCRCCKKYCHADIYSYALVMWEVLSRTLIAPDVDDAGCLKQQPNENQQQPCTDNRYNPYMYRAPYQDRGVGWDPGFDDMRRVVCSADSEQNRPGVAPEWCANPITNAVVRIMQQCWFGRPSSRLDSMRVKKTLAKLIEQYSTTETEQQHKSEPEQVTIITTTTTNQL